MTNGEKDLFLKDLCGRLQYKVKAQYYGAEEEMLCDDVIDGIDFSLTEPEILIGQYGLKVEKIKVYLRPMTSMTKEEKDVYNTLVDSIYDTGISYLMDWLNSHHLDWRGLIEKGLALEAKNDMYNF